MGCLYSKDRNVDSVSSEIDSNPDLEEGHLVESNPKPDSEGDSMTCRVILFAIWSLHFYLVVSKARSHWVASKTYSIGVVALPALYIAFCVGPIGVAMYGYFIRCSPDRGVLRGRYMFFYYVVIGFGLAFILFGWKKWHSYDVGDFTGTVHAGAYVRISGLQRAKGLSVHLKSFGQYPVVSTVSKIDQDGIATFEESRESMYEFEKYMNAYRDEDGTRKCRILFDEGKPLYNDGFVEVKLKLKPTAILHNTPGNRKITLHGLSDDAVKFPRLYRSFVEMNALSSVVPEEYFNEDIEKIIGGYHETMKMKDNKNKIHTGRLRFDIPDDRGPLGEVRLSGGSRLFHLFDNLFKDKMNTSANGTRRILFCLEEHYKKDIPRILELAVCADFNRPKNSRRVPYVRKTLLNLKTQNSSNRLTFNFKVLLIS
eukprot:792196_1